jgi:ABC-type transporter Mla MlaB component
LGATLSIHEASAYLEQVRTALAAGLVEIDAAALEAIDTAGVQLLLAAARAVYAQGRKLRLSHAHRLLIAAADALGLHQALAAVAELPA